MRSSLYSHFSESLSGLATIRAYGEQERFLVDNQKRVDVENRAYWLTVTNQRWLGIRLDFLGIILTFVVAILTVGTRFSISPSQTGVTLSYIITIQQSFGWLVRQVAEVENNMNSVERIVSFPSHCLPLIFIKSFCHTPFLISSRFITPESSNRSPRTNYLIVDHRLHGHQRVKLRYKTSS